MARGLLYLLYLTGGLPVRADRWFDGGLGLELDGDLGLDDLESYWSWLHDTLRRRG